jgi:hypothetical protein
MTSEIIGRRNSRVPNQRRQSMQIPADEPSSRSQAAGNVAGSRPLIVTTNENIPEARMVKTLGQVFGLTVRSRSLGGNIAALLKSLVGARSGPTSS